MHDVQPLCRIKKRLGGHAAMQDAQAADFFRAFKQNRLQTGACRRPRSRITAAAATDDPHVEIIIHAANLL